MRVTREDYHTARIAAILANAHSKHKNHKPIDFMWERERLRREQATAAREKRTMTGDEVLQRFRQLGVPIIDKRKRRPEGSATLAEGAV